MSLRVPRALLGPCLVLIAGCTHDAPQVGPPQAAAVPVSHPVQREVTDYVFFTGRTQAVEAADVRARVTDYIGSPCLRWVRSPGRTRG